MKDTSDAFAALVDARYAAMTPLERMQIVCGMRQTALAIIDSSLPPELTGAERRFAIMKRFYGDDLPDAALWAYARYTGHDAPTDGPDC